MFDYSQLKRCKKHLLVNLLVFAIRLLGVENSFCHYCFEQNRKFETKISSGSSALWARCTVPCCNGPVVRDVVWRGGSKGKFATNAIATPPLYPSPPPTVTERVTHSREFRADDTQQLRRRAQSVPVRR